MRDIKKAILGRLRKKKTITAGEIAELCNVSRQAAHGHLAELAKGNKIIRIGTTRGAYYVPYSKKMAKGLQKGRITYRARLRNRGLEEDRVYARIGHNRPAIKKLAENTRDILYYAFTEMLNNAIEYSTSAIITVLLELRHDDVYFEIVDSGIGIFNHIRRRFGLKDTYEALEELLKGKRTTMPDKHTGEGIFFTSKIADTFEIESSKTKLIIDNKKNDIYTEEIPARGGTKICFQVRKRTRKSLEGLFKQYTDEEYEFHKTKVTVRLYQKGVKYISRSQARRLIMGLDKFKVIVLDFSKVKAIGQGFADEVFRIFQSNHPDISINPTNCCKAVDFMIKRTRANR